jgi:hypothetical protein
MKCYHVNGTYEVTGVTWDAPYEGVQVHACDDCGEAIYPSDCSHLAITGYEGAAECDYCGVVAA